MTVLVAVGIKIADADDAADVADAAVVDAIVAVGLVAADGAVAFALRASLDSDKEPAVSRILAVLAALVGLAEPADYTKKKKSSVRSI